MKIEIEGFYGADEYDLLAEFFTKAANAYRVREAQQPKAPIGDGIRLGAGTLHPVDAAYSGTQATETEAAQWGTRADTGAPVTMDEALTARDAAAPAKRARRNKAQIEADAAADKKAAEATVAPANISTAPEDRRDPEVAGDEADEQQDFFGDEDVLDEDVADDLIDGYAVTDEGLVAAMKAYVAKFDMAAAQTNAKALFGGYTKRSEVTAAGEAAIATAIRNFANAVNTGKAA